MRDTSAPRAPAFAPLTRVHGSGFWGEIQLMSPLTGLISGRDFIIDCCWCTHLNASRHDALVQQFFSSTTFAFASEDEDWARTAVALRTTRNGMHSFRCILKHGRCWLTGARGFRNQVFIGEPWNFPDTTEIFLTPCKFSFRELQLG